MEPTHFNQNLNYDGKGIYKISIIPNNLMEEQSSIEEKYLGVLAFFENVFEADIRYRIISTLSKREGAGLREIARNVGISHKNVTKYIEALEEKGVVEAYPIGFRQTVYRLAPRYDFIRRFI